MELSVIIPAHNPRLDYLQIVSDGLRRQTAPTSQWELLVVDNKSEPALQGRLDLDWHPHISVVREELLGLTRARVAGFERARGELIVLVDDDNVLASDYLEQAVKIAAEFPFLGAWGGTIEPRYEAPETAPPESLHPLLTLRSATQDLWSNDSNHHHSTPWGAGLCVRRTVAQRYAEELRDNPQRQALDLHGQRLLYGGDTDIAYTACRLGLGKGVFTRLRVEHLIPARRCSAEHLCRVAEGRGYSEVLHHYVLHGSLPSRHNGPQAWARKLRRWVGQSPLERKVEAAFEQGRSTAYAELGNQLLRFSYE